MAYATLIADGPRSGRRTPFIRTRLGFCRRCAWHLERPPGLPMSRYQRCSRCASNPPSPNDIRDLSFDERFSAAIGIRAGRRASAPRSLSQIVFRELDLKIQQAKNRLARKLQSRRLAGALSSSNPRIEDQRPSRNPAPSRVLDRSASKVASGGANVEPQASAHLLLLLSLKIAHSAEAVRPAAGPHHAGVARSRWRTARGRWTKSCFAWLRQFHRRL